MSLRRTHRLVLTALTSLALLPVAAPSHADQNLASHAYSATGVRSAGVSKMGCTRYPSGRNIDVTRKMYEIAWTRGVSPKMMLALFEAGWVESWLNNLNCGDADSLGIFQMRPSMGWGTRAQLQDVTYQVNKWLDVAKPKEARYATSGQLAQAVEGSAYPTRYDQAASTAQRYINEAALPYGSIGSLWQSMGGANGSLGGAMSPEHDYVPTARFVQFSNGRIYRYSRGTFAIADDNYRRWLATGGYAKFGLPTSADHATTASATGPGSLQLWQRGWMYRSAKAGTHTVLPAMQSTFLKFGAQVGVGFPNGETVTDAAGNSVQGFEKAILRVSAAGVMTKQVR